MVVVAINMSSIFLLFKKNFSLRMKTSDENSVSSKNY